MVPDVKEIEQAWSTGNDSRNGAAKEKSKIV